MQANGMIFWDWNGTLMDDVDFTHSCLNWMLETHGYPQRYDLAAYREIFGFPIEEYYIRAGFNFAKHPYAELAERFMEHYNAGVDACPPSAHAAETLAELSRRGWRQSVLSASRRDYLIEQVAARGLQGYFTELLGLADIYGVSKVQVGKQWLAQSGIAPAACVMVGDTQHDAEVAKALGTKCVLYTGGHQSARGSRLCARMSSTIWHSCRSCWKPYNVHLTTSDLQKSEVVFVLAGSLSQSRIRSPAPPRGSLWRNRKLCVDCQGSHFGGSGCDQREQTERARLFASTTYLFLLCPPPAQIYRKFIQKPAKITLQV